MADEPERKWKMKISAPQEMENEEPTRPGLAPPFPSFFVLAQRIFD